MKYVTELATKKSDECLAHSRDSTWLRGMEHARDWQDSILYREDMGSKSPTWVSALHDSGLRKGMQRSCVRNSCGCLIFMELLCPKTI